jgi:phosphoribosylformylglycinamidine synthase
MITDNQALTVQNTLHQLGLPVTVRKLTHWEIHCDDMAALEQIQASGVLFNPRKESIISSQILNKSGTLLVRTKDDLIGEQKRQTLQDHFALQQINTIRHGTLWHFQSHDVITDLQDRILHSHIISNPYAHDCYHYSI